MNFKRRNEKGITLVALVVTIIILIILAGVSINLLVGQDGLISRAKLAKEQYENAAQDEQNKLNELYERLAGNWSEGEEEENNQLPVLTADTEAGTIVKLPDEWATETARYISTSTGLEVTSVTKVASVYAVSIGGGECVPVPYGFYYVGGDLSNGVIISDNEADKYDGTTDKTTFAYTTSLVGNQFVWIPCTTSAYTKTSWGKQNAEWDTTTPKAEVQQIEKYGGFYVGRYEAGLASDMSEFTSTQQHTGSNQVYNVYKTPQSKAGLAPWNFVDWTHSKANAESMYNNNYVSSGLITGTQWDVILNTFKSKAGLSDSDITNSNGWGNYKNTAIAYTGRKATAYYSSNYWYLPVFGSTETSTTTSYSDNHGDLLTTGASDTTQKYHIFDIAGNLWEWTEEDSHYATSGQYRVFRGGCYNSASSDRPACYRDGVDTVSYTSFTLGFRAVLYIK